MIGPRFAKGYTTGAGHAPDDPQGLAGVLNEGSAAVTHDFKYLRHKMQAEASE